MPPEKVSSKFLSNFPWLLLGILWVAVYLFFPIEQNDTWWHLKCGAWLCQYHSFPKQDPFSYSSPQTGWLRQSWLFEVLAWKVYAWAGPYGLIGAKLLVASLCALSLYLFAARRGALPAVNLLLLSVAFYSMRDHWTERPQSCAIACFALALWLLELPPGWQRRGALFALSVLWANLNGSVIVLPLFAFAYCVGAALEGREADWLALAMVFLGTLLSPQWGTEYLDALNFFGAKEAMRVLIVEWQAPQLTETPGLDLLLVFATWSLWRGWKARHYAWMLLLLLAAIGALRSGRLVPFFCVVVAAYGPILAFAKEPTPRLQRALGALVLALVVGHLSWMFTSEHLWSDGAILRSQFPLEAAEFLAADPPHGHLGNLYADGAYLLFRLAPQTKVFIDSREFIYPEKIFRAGFSLQGAQPAWTRVARDFAFSCMILPRSCPLYAVLAEDPDWKLTYFDYDYAIFASEGEIKSHAGRWPEYRGLDLLSVTVHPANHATTLALAKRLTTQTPDAVGYYFLGLAWMQEGKVPEAKEAMSQCLRLDPSQEAAQVALMKLNAQN